MFAVPSEAEISVAAAYGFSCQTRAAIASCPAQREAAHAALILPVTVGLNTVIGIVLVKIAVHHECKTAQDTVRRSPEAAAPRSGLDTPHNEAR